MRCSYGCTGDICTYYESINTFIYFFQNHISMVRKSVLIRELQGINDAFLKSGSFNTDIIKRLGNLLSLAGFKESGNGLVIAALKQELSEEKQKPSS